MRFIEICSCCYFLLSLFVYASLNSSILMCESAWIASHLEIVLNFENWKHTYKNRKKIAQCTHIERRKILKRKIKEILPSLLVFFIPAFNSEHFLFNYYIHMLSWVCIVFVSSPNHSRRDTTIFLSTTTLQGIIYKRNEHICHDILPLKSLASKIWMFW